MKTLSKIFAAVVLSFIATASFAQVSASATATGTIVTPIAIAKNVDMNFGNLATSGAGGTVVLPATSGTPTRTATGDVTLPANTGTVTAAKFTVTGASGYTYSITLPVAATTVTSGSNTMTVTTWTSNPTPTGVLTGGTQDLYIGATLNVGTNQAAGTYVSGTPFTVTVNYN